jgi:predicted ATPase
MADTAKPALIEVTVEGLFGLFDHRITFPPDWDFVIIHGVNGVGKTKVLDLIKSAMVGSRARLARIPFHYASLTFSDGSKIEITRTGPSNQSSNPNVPDAPLEKAQLQFSLTRPGRSTSSVKIPPHVVRLDPRTRDQLERFTPLVPIDEDLFLDSSSGETLSVSEALEQYGQAVPIPRRAKSEVDPEVPEAIRTVWQSSNVHLIETQRLLRPEATGGVRRARGERPAERTSTVMRFSANAAERVQLALSELGQRSQELDRTFPSRLVRPPSRRAKAPKEEDVRRRYNEQLKLRRRLTQISVLDAFGADLELPQETLDTVVLRVMTEFLNDSEEKFKVVEPLLDRLELLTNILNAKFQYKKLTIDRRRGFVIEIQDGADLRPDQLSSGEQHELVLFYDLLFEANDQALVLIDEPEISLHVNWQKRFLSDLREVSALTEHRFIVATHSPTIVGKFSDRMVQLEGSEDLEASGA